ncbi:MAG: hypothetical protein ABIO70_09750 [Pseudomonadota bacterium]
MLARDRRPDGSGDLWAFEAKLRKRGRLTQRLLEAQLQRFADHPLSPSHLVFVTTAARSTALTNWVERRRGSLPYDLQLWYWDTFENLVLEELGAGPWLSGEERRRHRDAWCARVELDFDEAGPLHPLPLARTEQRRLRDLFVPPRLRWADRPDGGPVSTGLPELLSDERAGEPCVLLLGEAGSGKSTLFLQAASDIAGRAREDQDRPLPLLLRAANLEQPWPAGALPCHDSIRVLWDDPLTNWVVLVDALDEVSLRGWRSVERQIQSLCDEARVRSVAVSCRPGQAGGRVLPSARRVALQRWSGGQAELFWEHWHGGEERPPKTPRTTSNPLELTLAARVGLGAAPDPVAYLQAVDELAFQVVDPWAEARGLPRAERLATWPTLQRVAWAVVQGHHPDHQDVASAMGAAQDLAGHLEMRHQIERAERDLGLFYFDEGGALRTSFRLVLEALASHHLKGLPVHTLAQALAHPATAETARLATIRRLCAPGSKPAAILDALVVGTRGEDPTATLRRAVQLARLAPLLPWDSPEQVRPLAEVLFSFATSERHPWRRQVAGEAITEAVALDGALGSALDALAAPLLLRTDSRSGWFDAYGGAQYRAEEDGPRWVPWASLLEEQDPAVRAVAIRRLAPWRDEPAMRARLEWALLDEGWDIRLGEEQPALVAGSLFRGMARDEAFAPLVPRLRALLASGHQLRMGAAALALRAGEAPAADLLHGLREAWFAWPGPRIHDAVLELIGEPDARAWVADHWRGFPETRPEPSPWPRQLGDSASPPCSEPTRRDLWRQLAPRLVRADRWHTLPEEIRRDSHVLAILCDAHHSKPAALFDLLQADLEDAPLRRWFPPAVQEVLGQLLLERPALVTELRRQWDEGRWSPPSSFPGVALERLVELGHPAAVELYREWLPHSPALELLVQGFHAPSQAVLVHPQVLPVARGRARELWRWAAHGREDQRGQRSHLHRASMGHALGALWPAWRDDDEISAGLLERALQDGASGRGEHEWFDAALSAWQGAPLPSPLAARLGAQVGAWRSRSKDDQYLYPNLPRWIAAAGTAGLLEPLAADLESVLTEGVGPAAYQAAIELTSLRPDESKRWSQLAALYWPTAIHLAMPAPTAFAPVLAAAAEAWVVRLIAVSRQWGPQLALETLGLAGQILELDLEDGTRREVLDLVRSFTGYRYLWLRGGRSFMAENVSGAAEGLLFEHGDL